MAAQPSGEVYDFTSDFSESENPRGAWTVGTFNHSYSGKLDKLENLTTYDDLKFTQTSTACGNGVLQGWGNFSAGFLGIGASASGVVKNTGKSASYSIPAGSVAVFPQHGPVVVRWTAPKAGNVNVRARFVNLTYKTDDGGFPELWILHKQDVSSPLHYEKAYSGTGKRVDHFAPAVWPSGPKAIYEGSLAIAASETINFVVDPMYTMCAGHSAHPEGNGTDIIGLLATISYGASKIAAK